MAAWQPTIEKIEALRKGDHTVRFSAQIEKGTFWFQRLFKKRFESVALSGQVAEIELRCDRKYAFFRYEPNVRYVIEEQDGERTLQLVGDEGTKLEPVQS